MILAGSNYVPVRELLPALHRLDTKSANRWLMVIQLCADVSGKDDQPVRVCAGLMGDQAHWERFEKEWRSALRDAGVSQFHATDFYACQREFAGWVKGSPKHIQFSRRFCAIAETQTMAGFVTGIEVDAFKRLLAPPLKGLKSTPNRQLTSLMMCCTSMLQDASEAVGRLSNKDITIAALFEGEDGIGQAIGYDNNLRKLGMSWTERYASVGTSNKSFLPLQGADLLAHASFQHLKGILRNKGEIPELQAPLRRLTQNQRIKIDLLTEEYITPMLPTLRRYLDEGNLI